MRNLIWSFIKRVARSRIGHLLVVLSLCFLLLSVFSLPMNHPQFVDCVPTGKEVYTITEVLRPMPVWIVAIGVTYFPSMLLTKVSMNLLDSLFSLSCYPTARLESAIFLVYSSIQWMLIGSGIEWLFKRKRRIS
jgi:hypothetical protein